MKKEFFDYGNFVITYRLERYGALIFLKEKIDDLDVAMKKVGKLKDMGYDDVKLEKNVK